MELALPYIWGFLFNGVAVRPMTNVDLKKNGWRLFQRRIHFESAKLLWMKKRMQKTSEGVQIVGYGFNKKNYPQQVRS